MKMLILNLIAVLLAICPIATAAENDHTMLVQIPNNKEMLLKLGNNAKSYLQSTFVTFLTNMQKISVLANKIGVQAQEIYEHMKNANKRRTKFIEEGMHRNNLIIQMQLISVALLELYSFDPATAFASEVRKNGTESLAKEFQNKFELFIKEIKGLTTLLGIDFQKFAELHAKDEDEVKELMPGGVKHSGATAYKEKEMFVKDMPYMSKLFTAAKTINDYYIGGGGKTSEPQVQTSLNKKRKLVELNGRKESESAIQILLTKFVAEAKKFELERPQNSQFSPEAELGKLALAVAVAKLKVAVAKLKEKEHNAERVKEADKEIEWYEGELAGLLEKKDECEASDLKCHIQVPIYLQLKQTAKELKKKIDASENLNSLLLEKEEETVPRKVKKFKTRDKRSNK